MTLRKRLSLIAAASVGIAVLIAIVGCYLLVRHQLRSQVDGSLWAQEREVAQGYLGQAPPGIPASAGGPAQYVQVVYPSGYHHVVSGGLSLPVSPRAVNIANVQNGTSISDVWVGHNHLRMLTMPVIVNDQFPAALELARPLNGDDNVLSDLRVVLSLLLIGGMAMAAVLGRLASRRVVAPLAEIADVAQTIAETDDLSQRLRVHADDEVGQLAHNFNAMLDRLESSRDALDESVRAQRQLVADASHELRTPVTSLRTNIEVLLEGGELDPEDRGRLLTDVVEQSEELSALVNDLIELARGDQPGAEMDDVRLDGVAEESLTRARRNAPGIHFDATLVPTLVDGAPERLARAINNLLDNAARHSPPGGTVEVQVGPKGVEVRDHGTGVVPEDLPYVFDRFFRGRNSRGRQGSGLGLAIVRQVAEQHGGSVSVTNAADGGAIFNLWLPAAPADVSATDPEPGPAHAVDPASGEPVKLS